MTENNDSDISPNFSANPVGLEKMNRLTQKTEEWDQRYMAKEERYHKHPWFRVDDRIYQVDDTIDVKKDGESAFYRLELLEDWIDSPIRCQFYMEGILLFRSRSEAEEFQKIYKGHIYRVSISGHVIADNEGETNKELVYRVFDNRVNTLSGLVTRTKAQVEPIRLVPNGACFVSEAKVESRLS